MQFPRLAASMFVALGAASACNEAPAPTSPPVAAVAPAGSAPPSPPADPAPAIGAGHYAECAGQGGNVAQLSPMFLEKMPACDAAHTAPAATLDDRAGDGSLIGDSGDCQYGEGIVCHFHSGMEFVTSDNLEDPEVGELHCIVPSADAQSPTVFGAHLRCKAGTSPASGTKACSAGLLSVLESCTAGWKCCDNGTLTKPVGKHSDDEKKLRPDFRVCEDASLEIDCGLLHGMHAHTANVVGLGEESTGTFPGGAHPAH